jgi:hypothetical protein
MKKGNVYSFIERNLIKEGIYLGEYFVEKGILNPNTGKFNEKENSKYPVYFFLSKEFGLLAYNSMKQIEKIIKIGEEESLSVKEINKLIKINRENNNKVFSNIFIKTIIKIKEY